MADLLVPLVLLCTPLSPSGGSHAQARSQEVPYKRTLVNQFSIAYDVYLEILHQVNLRVDKLEGEPPLQYSMLVTMDGNQSLKLVNELFRVGKTLRDDHHGNIATAAESAPAHLNSGPEGQMANAPAAPASQVPGLCSQAAEGGSTPPVSSAAAATDACEGGDYDEAFGFLGSSGKGNVQSQADIATCVKRWRNAGPELWKKMFALFTITGVFMCLCRHGHLLQGCQLKWI
ncbi:hypothetical protein FOMPIDRAFT_1055235 [Fomitopsis schrenkii]|uniref:Uncharacterized protein n=1 Tax=Fomitopsis schrenkii TaxID=2126942 RepID=S8DNV4_FOMSC|nr:hypothetical protein FOMPIDRAFT_1055235 [Fomitopsis schrenkii]